MGQSIKDAASALVDAISESASDVLEETKKSFQNTDADGATKNVKDIEFWGNGDTFKLISKAHSKSEGWMKSTKAMFTGTGCVIQVTTQQGDNVAEALVFVPDVRIHETMEDGVVISREIVPQAL